MRGSHLGCLVLLMLCVMGEASDCDDQRNCYDCVNKGSWNPFANCRWCPLDRRCHTYGAVGANPCTTDMNIKDDSGCPPRSDIYGTYDKHLAYEQAFISAIAYTDEPEVCVNEIKSNQNNFDFEFDSFIARKCDGFLFDYRECAVVVALSHTSRSVFVSFRGTTEAQQLIDQVLSILFEPKDRLGDGHVQVYFLEAFQKLESCLTTRLEELQQEYPEYTVRFSGHSLGGALASIAAFTYVRDGTLSKDKVTLYTYGMPRVGDKLYAVDHDQRLNNSFRVVNFKDCIPHFPTCRVFCTTEGETGPYHHRTQIFYDTSNMQLESIYEVCHANEEADCSHKYQGPIDTPSNIGKCIQYHKEYFDIPVGTHCDELSGRRRKRSGPSDLGHLLNSDHCVTLKSEDERWETTTTSLPTSTSTSVVTTSIDISNENETLCNGNETLSTGNSTCSATTVAPTFQMQTYYFLSLIISLYRNY